MSLFHIRKEVLKITQTAMAELAGTTQASVSRWENGELEPDRAQMARIRDEAERRNIPWDDALFFLPAPQPEEAPDMAKAS